MKYLLGITGLLIGIYVVIALSDFLLCYVDLRFSYAGIHMDHSEMWQECKTRHLTYPFTFF
jgi:hypothetical protein